MIVRLPINKDIKDRKTMRGTCYLTSGHIFQESALQPFDDRYRFREQKLREKQLIAAISPAQIRKLVMVYLETLCSLPSLSSLPIQQILNKTKIKVETYIHFYTIPSHRYLYGNWLLRKIEKGKKTYKNLDNWLYYIFPNDNLLT